MAPGLGLGLSIAVAQEVGGSFSPALVDDLFFELDGNGNLQPRLTLPSIDNSDIWDLDGVNIMPAATPNEEGFFEVDGLGFIRPKA